MTATTGSGLPPRAYNRIESVMIHTSRYAFMGRARLADDAGVARSTIGRILDTPRVPTLPVAFAITHALEQQLGRHLDVGEVFSRDGIYPTLSACELCGCTGCFPDAAYDDEGNLKAEYRGMRPGDWSRCDRPASPKEAR